MTFLYHDWDFLAKMAQIADNEIINEARQLAFKLSNKLADQAGQDEHEVYPRDLVDPITYLNFLDHIRQKDTSGNVIVFSDITGHVPPKNVQAYVKYEPAGGTTFYILKSGVEEQLKMLESAADTQGQELLRPLVSALKTGMEAILGKLTELNSDSGSNGNLPPLPSGGKGVNDSPTSDGKSSPLAGAQRVSQQTGGTKINKGLKQSVESLTAATLPFTPAQKNEISPRRIYQFISGTKEMLEKQMGTLRDHDVLMTGHGPSPYDPNDSVSKVEVDTLSDESVAVYQQFIEFDRDMSNNWSDWVSFVNGIRPPKNTSVIRDSVPYVIGQSPDNTLADLFGSKMEAMTAAQKLLPMLSLFRAAVYAIFKSTELVRLFTKNTLDIQYSEAGKFISPLQTLSRG